MFKRIGRALKTIALAAVANFQPSVDHNAPIKLSGKDYHHLGLVLVHGNQASGAARLKRAAKKRNNISTHAKK